MFNGGDEYDLLTVGYTEEIGWLAIDISNNTSNGGFYVSDNRMLCGICNNTRVKSFKDIQDSREFVLNLLDSYGRKI